MDNSNYYNRSFREEMFQYIPQNSQKVLEVGCSNGLFLDYVKQHTNCEVWGIEMNVTAAEKAAKVAHKVLSGDFNVVYTELPAHYFDCIVFNDVIEHFIDPWQALINAKSLLTEKGVIVSSIPNFRYIGNMTEIIKSADFRYREEGGILDKTHVRFFTAKSMKRLFEECGYQVIIQEGLRPCKSWKEKLFITLSCGFFNDMRFLQYAHVAAVKK